LSAQLQRPSACPAIETILLDKTWFKQYGVQLLEKLQQNEVSLYPDEHISEAFLTPKPDSEEDRSTEYLGLTVSVNLVAGYQAAIEHINKYGTKHSAAIITENEQHGAIFLQNVDAAAVYHNASTRYTDGFEFGYGAEIGISTQKLHARG